MWNPVSDVAYRPLNPNGQTLVVVCPLGPAADGVDDRWRDRACAVVHDTSTILRDVVRDLLANPQVRSIVFDGECCGRSAYAALWEGKTPDGFRIDQEHVALVTANVDLYDDEFNHKAPLAPFWPSRIKYLE